MPVTPRCWAIIFAITATYSIRANAYCRSSNCDFENSVVCTPASESDCGVPLYWGRQCTSFSIQQDASSQISFDEIEQTVTNAFASWESADCGNGTTPSIHVENLGSVSCNEVEYTGDPNQCPDPRGNAEVIMFLDDDWPHEAEKLAVTTVQFEPNTAEIYDADMEINTDLWTFSLDDSADANLQDVVTHELGHFLGLGHTQADFPDATMTAYYDPTADFASLSQDDIDAICAAYPPGEERSDECDPVPRHGFATECCDEQQIAPACSISYAAGKTSPWYFLTGISIVYIVQKRHSKRIKTRRNAPPSQQTNLS